MSWIEGQGLSEKIRHICFGGYFNDTIQQWPHISANGSSWGPATGLTDNYSGNETSPRLLHSFLVLFSFCQPNILLWCGCSSLPKDSSSGKNVSTPKNSFQSTVQKGMLILQQGTLLVFWEVSQNLCGLKRTIKVFRVLSENIHGDNTAEENKYFAWNVMNVSLGLLSVYPFSSGVLYQKYVWTTWMFTAVFKYHIS